MSMAVADINRPAAWELDSDWSVTESQVRAD